MTDSEKSRDLMLEVDARVFDHYQRRIELMVEDGADVVVIDDLLRDLTPSRREAWLAYLRDQGYVVEMPRTYLRFWRSGQTKLLIRERAK